MQKSFILSNSNARQLITAVKFASLTKDDRSHASDRRSLQRISVSVEENNPQSFTDAQVVHYISLTALQISFPLFKYCKSDSIMSLHMAGCEAEAVQTRSGLRRTTLCMKLFVHSLPIIIFSFFYLCVDA